MPRVELTALIESGAHFGHLTRRWNPKMKPYIFMEKNGIHIIDLKKTQAAIDDAFNAMYEVASKGHSVLFVGTKKQARGVIAEQAKRCGSNWVSERWLGGMLTNFTTIRKSVKRLQTIDKMESDGTFEKITKKERLMASRERDKLRKVLDGVESMQKMPGAIFIVDIKKESIAVQEAIRLNIPIFAIVDTNCDPDVVDHLIPSNDDAVSAIEVISRQIADAIIEGQAKAKELKAHESAEKERTKKEKEETEDRSKDKKGRVRRVRLDGKPAGKKADDKEEAKAEEKTEEPKKEGSEEAASDKE
ncbi:MAG: 30S ribosomal protein S2 [Ignavibacteriae bacterium]|jgi:small subunit ribosomal protein S2|nr:30S ribosomal protein S2 [Ignavibacteriota bacterium]